jgi:hypothetical protein
MTIYLANEIALFKPSFEAACEQILGSKSNAAFFSSYVDLIGKIRAHVLFASYIEELESTIQKQQAEEKSRTLEALEKAWLQLWRHEDCRWSHRKQLIQIKKMITHPREYSSSSVYDRIVCALNEFQERADWHTPPLLIPNQTRVVGNNRAEIQRNLILMAGHQPALCWEKFLFLHRCATAPVSLAPLISVKGRWSLIRDSAWNRSYEQCETEVLHMAQMVFQRSLSPKPDNLLSAFLHCERQIERKLYEQYLLAFKNHLYGQLLNLEHPPAQQEISTSGRLPGTLKEDFVKTYAIEFWKLHPNGKHEEAYQYYLLHCPLTHLLKRDRWNDIIRKRSLDPRPKEAKKRGLGKKTCNN